VADLDSADLLARCKRESGVPSTTEFPADADWYAWLGDAQKHYYDLIAAHAPWALLEAPVLLTSADSGVTYTFASSISPLFVELYSTTGSAGRLLIPGPYSDPGADYVWEGDTIRFPGNKAKTFSGGPYARIITPPTTIAADVEPTLPKNLRPVLVPHACVLWASRGGMRDPTPFQAREDKLWFGEPARGRVGMLVMLKQQNPYYGSTSRSMSGLLETVNTGSGYTGYP